MLHLEADRSYYVYPSWAQLPYAWADVARYLSDPINSPVIRDDPNLRRCDWRKLGYPIPIQPFELIDGPAGGGIIRAHKKRGEVWLPQVILTTGANLTSPGSVRPSPDVFDPAVCYIEPWDRPGWQLGMEKRVKLYICALSMEHVEGDPGNVYWIIGYKRGKREIKGLESIPAWAFHFSLRAVCLPSVPETLRVEVAPWFVDPSYEYAWFHVSGGGEGAGYQFAVVMYLGLHLRKVAGPRMSYMHLVSDIEGKPNARPFSFRR